MGGRIQVSEVFKSLQGEGICAGLPTVFVRLAGCNLYPNGCSFCDTPYAQGGNGKRMDPAEVLREVERLSNGCRRVSVTGGEPLYQTTELLDLVDRLKFREYFVEVFTNGTLYPGDCFSLADSWVVDIKCPSSGVADKCLKELWLETVRDCDLVKFVVIDVRDLDFVTETLKLNKPRAPVTLSPMVPNCPNSQFGEVLMSQRKWLRTVWEFCVEHNYRFSFQVHKLVFGNRRGV